MSEHPKPGRSESTWHDNSFRELVMAERTTRKQARREAKLKRGEVLEILKEVFGHDLPAYREAVRIFKEIPVDDPQHDRDAHLTRIADGMSYHRVSDHASWLLEALQELQTELGDPQDLVKKMRKAVSNLLRDLHDDAKEWLEGEKDPRAGTFHTIDENFDGIDEFIDPDTHPAGAVWPPTRPGLRWAHKTIWLGESSQLNTVLHHKDVIDARITGLDELIEKLSDYETNEPRVRILLRRLRSLIKGPLRGLQEQFAEFRIDFQKNRARMREVIPRLEQLAAKQQADRLAEEVDRRLDRANKATEALFARNNWQLDPHTVRGFQELRARIESQEVKMRQDETKIVEIEREFMTDMESDLGKVDTYAREMLEKVRPISKSLNDEYRYFFLKYLREHNSAVEWNPFFARYAREFHNDGRQRVLRENDKQLVLSRGQLPDMVDKHIAPHNHGIDHQAHHNGSQQGHIHHPTAHHT